MTLACEDANSKLVEAVTVADVDAEDRVGNSLLQIWELRLVIKLDFVQTLSTRIGQDFELKFLRQDFETGFCWHFAADVFVKVMKLNCGRESEARFGPYSEGEI